MPIEFDAFGRGKPLVLIAGPCVIESEEHVHLMAEGIRKVVGEFVFKASFDKANRTSLSAFRGSGMEAGLHVLAKVGEVTGLPVRCGPVEATALGNALVQGIALGVYDDVTAARASLTPAGP